MAANRQRLPRAAEASPSLVDSPPGRIDDESAHAAAIPWIEITTRVAPVDVDLVAEALREFAPDGVSIEPGIRTSDHRDFAYVYLNEPTLLRACVRAPFGEPQRRALRRRIRALPLSTPPSRVRYTALRTTDWSEEWKRFFHVLRVGRLVVRPSWEEVSALPGEVVIDLDPGAAFGTGQHETTRLCLAALDSHMRTGMRVLDIGTGSGILAIAAARLGAASVLAIDIDATAVEVARENVDRNAVGHIVEVEGGSLDSAHRQSAVGSDLIVANISSQTVLALLPTIAQALRSESGIAVLSGFISAAAEGIENAAREQGLEALGTTADGEWRCLVARKA
jgi:ribosomal protein L11 methyltransferase